VARSLLSGLNATDSAFPVAVTRNGRPIGSRVLAFSSHAVPSLRATAIRSPSGEYVMALVIVPAGSGRVAIGVRRTASQSWTSWPPAARVLPSGL